MKNFKLNIQLFAEAPTGAEGGAGPTEVPTQETPIVDNTQPEVSPTNPFPTAEKSNVDSASAIT